MPKLYSSDYIIKILKSKGFNIISQQGSHIKLRRFGRPTLTAIVPAGRKEMPIGTFRSILKQAGLSENDFK
ncbi:type II toxin-antitoxin system HicA family toxin [Mucilaginibacter sp.]|uniref:type II toxin-antitoxin system HicA family toxin n=1 Tax=Mucilaginibacter sp. TaxID=1882438 RepID=UPI003AFFFCB2